MENLANQLYEALGLKGTPLVVFLILLSMLCQLITRLIPDDSTGWRKTLRCITSVIGLYASNRITAGVTVTDVVKEVAKVREPEPNREVMERVDQRIEETVDRAPYEREGELLLDQPYRPPFPGFSRTRVQDGE